MRFITGLLFTFICLLPAGSMAQNKVTLSGKVIDQHGTPIAQATIAVENTTSGTYTDNRGKYSLQVAPGKHTIGHKRQRCFIGESAGQYHRPD